MINEILSSSSPKKIAIATSVLSARDATGNDVMGMYYALSKLNHKVSIIAEGVEPKLFQKFPCQLLRKIKNINQFDVLIFHHGSYWNNGYNMLTRFHGEIIFKFHNITPPHFFEPYCNLHYEVCNEGQKMLNQLVENFKNSHWLSDSKFNGCELIDIGVNQKNIFVAPPFHVIGCEDDNYCLAHTKTDAVKKIIFVGRIVPNKGHKHLLKILKYYVEYFSSDVELQIIGKIDTKLLRYFYELLLMIDQFKLATNVRFFLDVSNAQLSHLYREADLFLCMSEHEGFCVPLIEAQSHSLPVLAANTSAISETIGNALMGPFPNTDEDYHFYAYIINEVFNNPILRKKIIEQGLENVNNRFTHQNIENQFLHSMSLLLGKTR